MPKPRNYRNNPYYVPKSNIPTPVIPGGTLVRFQPPLTPIYPSPLPPRRPPTPLLSPGFQRALSGFAPKALAAGKAAASFKAPVGLGAVARRIVPFAGRAIPGIGWGFVALDTFLIACAAGWLPGNICPRPDNPSPGGTSPGFSGGQCPGIYYEVHFATKVGDAPETFGSNTLAFGAIRGVFKRTVGGADIWSLKSGDGGAGEVNRDIFSAATPSRVRIVRVVPAYGDPDVCGNPQVQPQPQTPPDIIINISNNPLNLTININPPNFSAPSPVPQRAPIVINPPSPLPDIYVNNGGDYFSDVNGDPELKIDYVFNAAPTGNFGNQPDSFNNFPPRPEPRLRVPNPTLAFNPTVGLAPVSINSPEVPPPLPDRLPPDSTEQDKYIYRQNKEALDKIYKANAEILEIQKEQQKQGKILENIQSLLDVEVEGSQLITRCDDADTFYSYKAKVLTAINQQLNHIKAIEQTIISEICQVEASAAVAAPDWWAVRLGGDIPQLALIFRVVKTRTYHTLVVPHPINTAPLTIAPIPNYKKGNWMGMITCRDNSKFICNCGTKGEATRLLFIAASLIDPIFLGDPVRFYYAERKGGAVAEGDMRGTSAQYFPMGQRQTKPLWRVTFTRDGQ